MIYRINCTNDHNTHTSLGEFHGVTFDDLDDAEDALSHLTELARAGQDDRRYEITEENAPCQCGEAWEGSEPCHAEIGADAVILESMPVGLRASHEAAGGFGGVYPFDGSQRYSVTPGCAAHLIAHDPDWSRLVPA